MTNLYYKLTIVYCAFPDNLPKWAFLHHQHLLLSLHAKLLQSCPSLCNPMDCSLSDSSVHGDSPGKNTGVGCHAPPGNPGLPHCRRILYCLSHQRNPRILEWVTYPCSRGSSQPRNWTRVSCLTGGFFTSWVTRKDIHTYVYITCRYIMH